MIKNVFLKTAVLSVVVTLAPLSNLSATKITFTPDDVIEHAKRCPHTKELSDEYLESRKGDIQKFIDAVNAGDSRKLLYVTDFSSDYAKCNVCDELDMH